MAAPANPSACSLARVLILALGCCCVQVVGGLSLKVQEAELRGRPDIVVCTPGRIVDLLTNSPSVHMDDLDILVAQPPSPGQ